MLPLIIILLLVLLGSAANAAPTTRRLLHQPFLPADHPSTTPPPAAPFFPAVAGGAAPPPANYPTLVLPNATTSAAASLASASRRPKKLVLGLAGALPLLALAGIAVSFVFFSSSSRGHRRAVDDHKLRQTEPPESRRPHRPDSDSPDHMAGVHPPALAELARVGKMEGEAMIDNTPSSGRSPDLRPLPPLLQRRRYAESGIHRATSDSECTDEYDGDDEEFYSPGGSSLNACSRRTLGTKAEAALAAPALALSSPGEPCRRSVELRSVSARRDALHPAPTPAASNPLPLTPTASAGGYWESRVRMPESSALSLRVVEPAVAEEEEWVRPKPKLKALHGDTVARASLSSDHRDELLKHPDSFKSFELHSAVEEKRPTAAAAPLPRRPDKMATLLRSLRVSKEEVCEALRRGNAAERLGAEVLEALLKMASAPASGEDELFAAVPFALRRVEAMLYMANFDTEIGDITGPFQVIEAACDELRSCSLFHELLDAVLNTGDRMVADRGDAHASELDALLTLADVRAAADSETTLLHQVLREEQHLRGKLGLQAVASLGDDLASVKAAAAMDSDLLAACVTRLAGGLAKVADVQRLVGEDEAEFHGAMSRFVSKAEDAIIRAQAQESVARSLVKEITECFHGDLDREEAHPFRIFAVVRDFLAVLHRVCGEVEADAAASGNGDHFPVPVNPMVFQRMQMQTMRAADFDDLISSSSSW